MLRAEALDKRLYSMYMKIGRELPLAFAVRKLVKKNMYVLTNDGWCEQ